jgi:Spy/CpxP family protein refolding chaperone
VNTWKVILATMIIFGAGVITGGLVVRQAIIVQARKLPRNANGNRPALPVPPALTRVDFLKRAERELDLTREQKDRADKIIAASQERSRKLIEPVNPQLRQELRATRDEFRAVLTPEQQTRFDDLLKQQNRPREQHRPGTRNPEAPVKLKESPVGDPAKN